MDNFKIFLDSSTIHGLSYISNTKRYPRFFWMLTVASGFSFAFYLIFESFSSWTDTPVKTMIETMPIKELKLPKVTVCPPKNTFTDLNYDLMLAENNTTLTREKRYQIFGNLVEVIEDHVFMDDLNKMEESNRFYNWYHGLSKIKFPSSNKYGVQYEIETSATSGLISTEKFLDNFEETFLERLCYYKINIYRPMSIRKNKKITLRMKIEKVTMKGVTSGFHDDISMVGLLDEYEDQFIVYQNYTPVRDRTYEISLHRRIDDEDLEHSSLDVMPGFNFSWYYVGGEVENLPFYPTGYYYEYVRYQVQKDLLNLPLYKEL